ncbi:MAG TPA: response regulator [Candidatus Acidoferrum sp.]|jgi:DNA-binding response OmpR family regulator|nr:response regulator [Candidatus Acidoferrum sp.]
MAANNILLCIHRDPEQLRVLQEHGYNLVTATDGCEGLRLLMSRSVDAIVLEHYLGLLDGSTIAYEIRQVRPEIPIVLVTDHLELPDCALNSVDALVTKSDGAHFLWATVHFVLNVKPAQRLERLEGRKKYQTTAHLRRPGRGREPAVRAQVNSPQLANREKDAAFPRTVWRGIRNGTIQF